MTRRHLSTAWPLAAALAVLVVYASWYPFSGWRWPSGAESWALLVLPWVKWSDPFDEWSNFAGYVVLGALLHGAHARGGGGRGMGMLLAVGLCTLLSLTMEIGQQFLPQRVPSMKDTVLNLAGAFAGSLLGMAVQAAGLVDAWHRLRQRWFERDSAPAFVLMLLWPVALLFPLPMPLGVGQIWETLGSIIAAAFEDTPWQGVANEWLSHATWAGAGVSRIEELLIVALGLLSPCLVAYAITPPGARRLLLSTGALALGLGATTLSTALNFGPSNAWAWWTASTLPALALGLVLGVTLSRASQRTVAALGLVALALLVTLVSHAPADPYFAASLQGWEQGRFIRFHGIAQWVGWLWPYAAMAWLLWRLTRRP